MTKKSFAITLPLIALLLASLACNALSGGGTTNSFEATANAAFTQAAAGVATAGAQGNSAEATANAAFTQAAGQGVDIQATDAVATANAATGNNTGDATATPADAATATTGDNGDGTTATGGPADVPLVDAKNTIQVANDQVLSYYTDADVATTITFYKDAMPKNGWTFNETLSVETASAATLSFSKDGRNAQIVIGDAAGKTIVAVTVS